MITPTQVHAIHEIMVRMFGGLPGVREEGLLLAAIERPFGGFGDHEFYPSPAEKAAAIFESLLKNHPLLDGNKRTGYVLMRLILNAFGHDIAATEDEKYDFVIAVAGGKAEFEWIVAWIQDHLVIREN